MMDWELINSEQGKNYQIFKVRQDEYRNCISHQKFRATILQGPDSVNVVAINEYDEIVMVNQFRYGIRDYSLEIPGGMIDFGEQPLVSAKRELKEETGYISDTWILLGSIYSNPVFMNNKCYHYLALNAVKIEENNPDPEEQIRIELISKEDLVRHGLQKIAHPHTLSALCRYLNFEKPFK